MRRIRSIACDRVGTHPASIFESDVSEHPAEAASWRWVRFRVICRARRRAASSAPVAMLLVVVDMRQSLAHGSERNCGRAAGTRSPDEALADHGWRCAISVARAVGTLEIASATRLVDAAVDAMARFDRPVPGRKRDREALARRRFLVLRDAGAGALIVANRQLGHTLRSASSVVSALYGLGLSPTTGSDWSQRWVELQQRLGATPSPIPTSGDARRLASAARRRDRAEADFMAMREPLRYKAERAGVVAQEIPQVVAGAMRGDPDNAIRSSHTEDLAAERLAKVLEAQASIEALNPTTSDIVVGEVELRRLAQGWRAARQA